MSKSEEDITEQLLDEIRPLKKEKEPEQTVYKPGASNKIEKKKTETIASETVQDRFRKIVRDQGYVIGLENMTSIFFEGNTDSPSWLDDVLKLSHIPAKSREIIISAYYGKTIAELGITVTPNFQSKVEEAKKIDDAKKIAAEDDLDLEKMSQEEMKNSIRNEKTMLALAQMKKMRKEIESSDRSKEVPQQQYQMRQVIRPIMKDGNLIRSADGTVLTETLVEPVVPGQQNNDIVNMLAMRALVPQQAPVAPAVDQTLVDYIKKLDQKIENMESSRQIQAKEDEIRRMNDKLERKEEEYKRDMDRKEKEFTERLDKMNEERVRDLNELKERFQETIQHKKELDDIVGQVSVAHKKEIDGLKSKLERTETNIERTIVSKSTDTVDKLTGKVGDIAESVIKPMADVMKDHYRTVIDQTRANTGLPSLRDTVPKINESELEQFARGE